MSDFHLVDSQGWELDLQSVRTHSDHAFTQILNMLHRCTLHTWDIFSLMEYPGKWKCPCLRRTDPLMLCEQV
jgi:hypothetical protein